MRGTQTRHEQIAIAALAFGIICRLTQYLADSSLWYDESFVALNVLGKNFGAMLGPLDWSEASPPGFLAAEKLIVSILGSSEYALRLLPLMAGIAALLLFASLTRRLYGDRPAMLWALIMFAAWPTAISQAATLKHFSLDMLFSALELWLVLPMCEGDPKAGPLMLWGALSAAGVWLSYAAVFSFAGCSIVLAARALRGWPRRERIAFAAANLVTLVSLMALRHPALAQRSAGLMDYWTLQRAFPEGGAFGLTLWLAHAGSAFCGYFWRAPGWMLMVVAGAGAASLWIAGRRAATLMLLAPVAVALAASFAHLWPFGENQHMSFAAPAMIALLGQGCESIRGSLSQRRRWLGEAALAALLGPVLINSAYRAVLPRHNSDLRSVIEFFQKHREPGDAVIASDPATVKFYTGRDFRYDSPPITASARLWVISIPALRPLALDRVLEGRALLARTESYGGAQARLFGPRATAQNAGYRR